MGGGVIEDDLDFLDVGRDGSLDAVKEGTEFVGAVLAVADRPDDSDIERAEERGRALADVVLPRPLSLASPNREGRLVVAKYLRPGSSPAQRTTAWSELFR